MQKRPVEAGDGSKLREIWEAQPSAQHGAPTIIVKAPGSSAVISD